MTLTILKNATISDVKRELSRMLTEGIKSSNVRQLTERAIAGRQDKIGAIFDFARDTFPYTPDPVGRELFVHPNRVAEDYFQGRVRGLDCDDYALLTGAMLGCIGYQVRLALLDIDWDNEIDHAISQYYSEPLGEWINCDASADKPLGWIIQARETIYALSS